MTDMLVSLYAPGKPDRRCGAEGIVFKRALALDAQPIISFVQQRFTEAAAGWADECAAALYRQPCSCFVATDQQRPIGFICYDATAKGMIGPLGVDSDYRRGIAGVLLNLCLEAMQMDGYAYAAIGWVSSEDFYRKNCNAMSIPDSAPGIYSRMLTSGSLDKIK